MKKNSRVSIAQLSQTADFAVEKQMLIENLNFLKTLSVREYTLYKKWDELRHYSPPQPELVQKAKDLIWRHVPNPDANAPQGEKDWTIMKQADAIRPKLIAIGTSKADTANFRRWDTYQHFISSGENNGVRGRIIKFLIVDDADERKRVLGIAAVASDVNAIGCRDKYIGWTKAHKATGKLNHIAIASTVVPTQPFGFTFLGGKLIAALMTTRVVRDEWQSRYGDVLVGMTTTSLFGSPCMYDGIPRWRSLGHSNGSLPIVPSRELYHYWRRWIAAHRAVEFEQNVKTELGSAGAATSEKFRALDLIFNTVGLSLNNLKHGFRRGVYFSSFYENTREFLCGKIPESRLVLKPSIQGDVEAILNWWRPRAIQRYLNVRRRNQLTADVQWYSDMNLMDYKTAKAKYLPFVGA